MLCPKRFLIEATITTVVRRSHRHIIRINFPPPSTILPFWSSATRFHRTLAFYSCSRSCRLREVMTNAVPVPRRHLLKLRRLLALAVRLCGLRQRARSRALFPAPNRQDATILRRTASLWFFRAFRVSDGAAAKLSACRIPVLSSGVRGSVARYRHG